MFMYFLISKRPTTWWFLPPQSIHCPTKSVLFPHQTENTPNITIPDPRLNPLTLPNTRPSPSDPNFPPTLCPNSLHPPQPHPRSQPAKPTLPPPKMLPPLHQSHNSLLPSSPLLPDQRTTNPTPAPKHLHLLPSPQTTRRRAPSFPIRPRRRQRLVRTLYIHKHNQRRRRRRPSIPRHHARIPRAIQPTLHSHQARENNYQARHLRQLCQYRRGLVEGMEGLAC